MNLNEYIIDESFLAKELSNKENIKLLNQLKMLYKLDPEDADRALERINTVRKSEDEEPISKEMVVSKKTKDIQKNLASAEINDIVSFNYDGKEYEEPVTDAYEDGTVRVWFNGHPVNIGIKKYSIKKKGRDIKVEVGDFVHVRTGPKYGHRPSPSKCGNVINTLPDDKIEIENNKGETSIHRLNNVMIFYKKDDRKTGYRVKKERVDGVKKTNSSGPR